jgi:hypothetical protein
LQLVFLDVEPIYSADPISKFVLSPAKGTAFDSSSSSQRESNVCIRRVSCYKKLMGIFSMKISFEPRRTGS